MIYTPDRPIVLKLCFLAFLRAAVLGQNCACYVEILQYACKGEYFYEY